MDITPTHVVNANETSPLYQGQKSVSGWLKWLERLAVVAKVHGFQLAIVLTSPKAMMNLKGMLFLRPPPNDWINITYSNVFNLPNLEKATIVGYDEQQRSCPNSFESIFEEKKEAILIIIACMLV